MVASVISVTIATGKINFVVFVIYVYISCIKIVIQPTTTDYIGCIYCIVANFNRFKTVGFKIFVFFILLKITLSFCVIERNIRAPIIIESLIPQQLIVILRIIIHFVIIKLNVSIFIGVFTNSIIGSIIFKLFGIFQTVPRLVGFFSSTKNQSLNQRVSIHKSCL